MKKRVSVLFAAAMAAVLLAGCAGKPAETAAVSTAAAPEAKQESSEASAETEARAQETFEPAALRVAYMPNMGSASLAVTARDKGFFEEMGLTVELVEFQGGPAEIAAMASGDIDISQIGHGAHALCAEGEALIFQIDCTSLADAVIGNADKGVHSIADLRGKKVAATSGTSAEIILKLALQSEGISPDELEIVEMDANGIVTAMISGNVDACASWSPGTVTIDEALGDKAVWLATNQDFIDQATFPSSFITTAKFAEEKHDLLVRFTRALQKAADYRSANIEEVAGLVAKQCEVSADTMLSCVGEGNWDITSEFLGRGLEDGTIKRYYENQQKVFIDGGRLTGKVDVENYVLFDVMKEAYEANKL
ncbi:ABC transporter substrate-binding protein [Lacrimispora sp. 210928-DFI.3.58]|uniref:ABC transporter substrate-binding protein n=1 Tax=Lacrimispora sp. 210928-DFI.3.58 TaxID=2883214 RepID=UPI001D07EB16|nr:ABC transporter substrate-binding protein [Lacrimispora sp. 210928-DFI.3.58]MCB7319085.1 ABC transporter substrate-binding protein [Lacrimispora sp. 210928-DFI.3.58]